MYRVVYETREQRDCDAIVVKRTERLPAAAVDLQKSTVRGVPVNILHHHHIKLALPKSTPAMRTSRKNYNDLKIHLYRHFRRSSWRESVYLVIDGFIKDLEWEEVLREAKMDTKSFTYHWHRFTKQFVHELRWSPNTRNMLPRLERQTWLLAYLEEDMN